jgi:Flp pilus assembly secretin CpaC/serine/threonine protein kinase
MAVIEMDRIAHPAREKLHALAHGRLAADEIETLEDHLAVCESCCLLLEQTHDDSFVDRLRDARELSPLAAFRNSNDAELPSELVEHPRYRLIRLLGRGGMGAVYLADHRRMGRPVALKVINAELLNQHGSLSRFQQEVRTAAKLDHPNIVAAYDADQAGEVHFLVMEYVEGQNLADAVKENGPLTIAQSCDIIRQAALGLQHAHERGMVHRDIKPHNMMLTPAGQVKVLDFGLARIAAEPAERLSKEDAGRMPHLTGTGTVMGSADYIAPEQAHDSHAADCRSDIYSLGCTLYYLLTKRPPFPDGTAPEKLKNHRALAPCSLTALRAEVPVGLAKVVAKMMAKRPEDRYQSAAEVAGAIASFCGKPAPKPFRFRPRSVALVALLTLATISIAAAAGVVRLDAGDREIVIETDDPTVEVIVKGDRIVRIVDPQSGKAYQLDRNDLTLMLADDPGGLSVVLDGDRPINLKRQGKQIASVRLEAKAPPAPSAAARRERQIVVDTIIASVDHKEAQKLIARWLGDAKDGQRASSLVPTSQRFEIIADSDGFRKDLHALSDKKKAVQYANPTITILNGQSGRFESGGQTPILTSDAKGTPGVTFKNFGMTIDYLPAILQDGTIRLNIRREITARDSAADINAEGQNSSSIVGFNTRSAEGTVLVAAGQSILLSAFNNAAETESDLFILATPRIVDPEPKRAPPMPPAAALKVGDRVPGVPQVTVETIIASVDRNEAQQLFARWLGDAKRGQKSLSPASASQRFEIVSDGDGLRKDLQVLSDKDMAHLTAGPAVVLLSGRPGYIVDGGETPILTSDANGTPSVTYKTFGTVINYTPIVHKDGKIQLRICPEISKLNPKADIKVEGNNPSSIPGFNTQTVEGTVLLASGQSVLVSGFKDAGRPGKELIILATPRIVDPNSQPTRQVQLNVVVANLKSKEARQLKHLIEGASGQAIMPGDPIPPHYGILKNADRFRKELAALRDKKLAKFVEERQVMTLSGQPCHIVNGGETPILTTSGKGDPNVTYKTYGTVVNFLPIVLGNDKIHLEVRPELSNINQEAGIQLSSEVGSTSVPGFDVRSVQIAVQMEDGQTLAMIGMPRKTTVSVNATESREIEEEVVILVTPRVK